MTNHHIGVEEYQRIHMEMKKHFGDVETNLQQHYKLVVTSRRLVGTCCNHSRVDPTALQPHCNHVTAYKSCKSYVILCYNFLFNRDKRHHNQIQIDWPRHNQIQGLGVGQATAKYKLATSQPYSHTANGCNQLRWVSTDLSISIHFWMDCNRVTTWWQS